MRVLHVINTLEIGGAEHLVAGLLPLLERRGVDASVLVLALGSRVLYERMKKESIDVSASPRTSLYSPFQVRIISDFVKERRVGLIHAHLFPAMLWAAIAQIELSHVPLIVTEHNTWSRRRRALWKPLDRFMYARTTKIACVSGQTEDALRQWLPETEGRTCVVENGIDSLPFDAAAAAEGIPRCTIATVARLTKQKAIDVLIRAVAELPGVTVLIVGDGPMRRELENLAQSLKVAGRVHFLGTRCDVPAVLRSAPIYVQPSAWEGFGIAAVEAMSAGLAVVVSDVPGLREVVGDAGLTFSPGSHLELARVLRGLVGNRELIAGMSARSRSRAASFSLSRTADEYVALYRQVWTSFGQPEASGLHETTRPRKTAWFRIKGGI